MFLSLMYMVKFALELQFEQLLVASLQKPLEQPSPQGFLHMNLLCGESKLASYDGANPGLHSMQVPVRELHTLQLSPHGRLGSAVSFLTHLVKFESPVSLTK